MIDTISYRCFRIAFITVWLSAISNVLSAQVATPNSQPPHAVKDNPSANRPFDSSRVVLSQLSFRNSKSAHQTSSDFMIPIIYQSRNMFKCDKLEITSSLSYPTPLHGSPGVLNLIDAKNLFDSSKKDNIIFTQFLLDDLEPIDESSDPANQAALTRLQYACELHVKYIVIRVDPTSDIAKIKTVIESFLLKIKEFSKNAGMTETPYLLIEPIKGSTLGIPVILKLVSMFSDKYFIGISLNLTALSSSALDIWSSYDLQKSVKSVSIETYKFDSLSDPSLPQKEVGADYYKLLNDMTSLKTYDGDIVIRYLGKEDCTGALQRSMSIFPTKK